MTLPEGRLVWVRLPRACAGLIVRGGVVVDAAPYLRRYLGVEETVAAARLRAAGAELVPLDDRTSSLTVRTSARPDGVLPR